MGLLIRTAVVLAAYTLLPIQAFSADWSTIIPQDSPSPLRKEAPRSEKTIKVGEIVKIPLAGNRSYTCPAEVHGGSVRIVSNDLFETLILQAVKPGVSTVRIFRKFWRDPDVRESYVPVQEILITVTAKTSRNPFQAVREDREDVPAPRLSGNMDWQGNISRQSEEMLTVITDSNEWAALWNTAFNKPAPKIDFEKYAIACVFLGFNADWLFHIHIGEPKEEGRVLIIPYGLSEIILELSGPFRASGQYRMKAVPKKKGYGMLLEKSAGSGT